MGEFLIFNGEVVGSNVALSYQNRAFRYGDGFFETIRCMDGRPLWLDRHFQRMKKSARALKIDLAIELTQENLSAWIQMLLSKNSHNQGARVRISVFREDGGFYMPQSNKGHMLINSNALSENQYSLNANGKMIGVFTELHKPCSRLSFIKSSSALVYVMASLHAAENKWDDCIILNEHGNIAETSSSNLFMVKKRKLFTPGPDQGCVDGIMKNIVIETAKKASIKVMDCALKPNDLTDADEVFLTNAVQGIQWVKGFGVKRYYHEVAGELAIILQKNAILEIQDPA
jgi:branched-chain amino acid aminotransferase